MNLDSTHQSIVANIHRFDICSLLRLLKEMSYQIQDIYFESNADISSHPYLCQGIVFSENTPKVKITVNIGLLSANSPLPSFFRKKMDSGSIDPVLFSKFLSFFDHHIIKNLLLMSTPDLHHIYFSNWRQTQGYYLKLLDLNSTSTLWHLFQVCFPELTVKILKSPQLFKHNSSSTMLGSTRLGKDSFLGKKFVQSIPSFKFILIGDETHTSLNRPWPIEIKERLKHLALTFLQRTDIHFRVTFILKRTKAPAHLSHRSALGYCMIGESIKDLKLLLFSGSSKELCAK